MADKTITERLQPSLLDRLTDLRRDARSESRDERVIDMRQLRDIIRRDLSWLMNTSNAGHLVDAETHPHASASVLNFGLNEVSGQFSTEERVRRIRASITRAIETFEPRLKHGTLEVVARPVTKSGEAILVFDIRADMWAQPLPMELYLRSEVDVTTGQVTLERAGG